MVAACIGAASAQQIQAFSVAYADQNDEGHSALKRGISSGKLAAVMEEPKQRAA